LLLQIKKDNQ